MAQVTGVSNGGTPKAFAAATVAPDASNVRPWFDQAKKDLKAINDEYNAGVSSDRRKQLVDGAERIARQAENAAGGAKDPKQKALLLVIAASARGALFSMKEGIGGGIFNGKKSLSHFKDAFALAPDVVEVAIAYGMSQVPLLHHTLVKPSPDEVRAAVKALAAFPDNPVAQMLRLKLASWQEAYDGQQINGAKRCIDTLCARHDPDIDKALHGTEGWLNTLENAKRK